jgi:hypothetical protein
MHQHPGVPRRNMLKWGAVGDRCLGCAAVQPRNCGPVRSSCPSVTGPPWAAPCAQSTPARRATARCKPWVPPRCSSTRRPALLGLDPVECRLRSAMPSGMKYSLGAIAGGLHALAPGHHAAGPGRAGPDGAGHRPVHEDRRGLQGPHWGAMHTGIALSTQPLTESDGEALVRLMSGVQPKLACRPQTPGLANQLRHAEIAELRN